MKVTIVGAGAIGSIVGAHMIRAGHDVTFVDVHAAHVQAIRENGLRLTGQEDFTVRAPALLPEEMGDSLRAVFLAVKSRHTESALESIAPRLAADGYVLSLQNGLEEYKIAARVGEQRTVGAFLTFGGHYEAPGHVVFSGTASFYVGELDGRDTTRVRTLQEALSSVQEVRVTGNIFGHLWGKMALGAYYFATALVSADVPDIIRAEKYLGVLGRLVAEVVAVGRACGVRCETVDGFDPNIFPLDGPPEARAAEVSWQAQLAYWGHHGSSDGYRRTGVWRDLAIHHRPTEVDELVECVTSRAREHGVAVPRLERLVALIKSVERGERSLGWENLDELAALDRALVG